MLGLWLWPWPWVTSVLQGLQLGSSKVLVLLALWISPQLWSCVASAFLNPQLQPQAPLAFLNLCFEPWVASVLLGLWLSAWAASVLLGLWLWTWAASVLLGLRLWVASVPPGLQLWPWAYLDFLGLWLRLRSSLLYPKSEDCVLSSEELENVTAVVEVLLYSWPVVDISISEMDVVLPGKDVPRAPVRLPSPDSSGKGRLPSLTLAHIPEALQGQGEVLPDHAHPALPAPWALQVGQGCEIRGRYRGSRLPRPGLYSAGRPLPSAFQPPPTACRALPPCLQQLLLLHPSHARLTPFLPGLESPP